MAFDLSSRARESPGASTRVESLFDALLARDGAGGSWLAPLLRASPRGAERLGDLVTAPGWLEATIAVRTETGRRGAFEQPAAPSRRLLGFYVDHPEKLTRPAQEDSTAEAARLRRALIDDDPPGLRARAQERAHELLRRSAPLGPAWWRFEEAHRCDCLLITDRLVLLVRDGDEATPATPWFPARTGRVRDLEAAERIADGGKSWAVLTLARTPAGEAGRRELARALEAGAPHLDAPGRAALLDGDLGELSWAAAAAATDLALGSLPGFSP